jgi:HPt (histidine-containing phosphotransfer) domain-containing protein
LLAEFRRELDLEAPFDADRLHTLKGSSSTLGARRIAEAAAALEQRVRKGEPLVLDELNAAIAEVKRSIDSIVEVAATESVPSASASSAMAGPQLLQIAKQMHEHLRDNNLAAVTCFEEMKSLVGARYNGAMKALEASLDRLDFEAARAHLAEIESQLPREHAS